MTVEQVDILLLGPHWTQQITRNAFWIFLQSDWQINNGFFNMPVMVHTQILVHRWRPRTWITWMKHEFLFQCWIADWLNQKLLPICGTAKTFLKCKLGFIYVDLVLVSHLLVFSATWVWYSQGSYRRNNSLQA